MFFTRRLSDGYLVSCTRGRKAELPRRRSVGWLTGAGQGGRAGDTGRSSVIAMEAPLKGVSVARARHALPSVAAAARRPSPLTQFQAGLLVSDDDDDHGDCSSSCERALRQRGSRSGRHHGW